MVLPGYPKFCLLYALARGMCNDFGVTIATVQRFRPFAKAAAQEMHGMSSDFGVPNCSNSTFSPLRKGSRARNAMNDFWSSYQPGTALLPCSLAACSLASCRLAVRNLLPVALPAALQPAALRPCNTDTGFCLPKSNYPARNDPQQRTNIS